jgi:hypothetical protein
VLEQVVGELLLEPVLVALEVLAVVGREPDRVVVGHVGVRDRTGLVVLHLLRQLARDLDRLDLGAERAAEGAADQPLKLRLEVP